MRRGIIASSGEEFEISTEVGQVFVRATDPGQLSAIDQIEFTITGASLPTGEFLSDAVCWPETNNTIGLVPNEFVNYTMLRCMCMHFNLHEICTFSLNGIASVIYAHPTFEDQSFRPPFLSTWTNTGLTGTMQVPDINGVDLPCTVYYYTKPISELNWTWYSQLIEERLSYFVGWFLFPPGVVIESHYPEVYEPLGSISAPYIKPPHDSMMWDNSPPSRPATTSQSTSWANFGTRMNNASGGDVVAAPIGTFINDGVLTISNVQAPDDNPIWLVGAQQSGFPTTVLRGVTGIRFDNCRNIRVYGFFVDDGTGNSSHTFFSVERNCQWVIIQENWMDDYGSDNHIATVHGNIIRGDYCRVSHSAFSNKQSPGGAVRLTPSSGVNDAGQFCRFDHLKCLNWNDLDLIPPGPTNYFMIAAGQNANFDQRIHTLLDHNHEENFHVSPGDSEGGLLKGMGCVVWANRFDDMKGRGMNSRQAAWSVFIRNLETLNKTNARDDSMTSLQGTETQPGDIPEGELILAGNWTEKFGHANGWLSLSSVSSTSTNRYVIIDALVTGNMGFDIRRRYFRFSGTADNKPQNVHLIGNAADCDEAVVDEQYTEPEGDFHWSGNVFNGSSLGMVNPGGIIEADPGFVDRGDSIFLPTHPGIDVGVNTCYPVRLENKVIPNLGTTYASI